MCVCIINEISKIFYSFKFIDENIFFKLTPILSFKVLLKI